MIYLIRHGETDWNKMKVMQGQTDIPLNSNGIEQAKQVSGKLKDVKIDIIFCSPLIRTRQTLENLNRTEKVIFDDRLMERNYGKFEKTSKSSFDYNAFWNYSLNSNMGGGELCQDFFSRVFSLLNEIKEKYHNKNVLIVTHAGVTKVFKYYFDGLKDDEIGPYLPSNCEVIKYPN